ncbi:acyl-CoA dehydrogenase family protein [Sphingomonas sp. NSE70-1]|uniref:Acyl-CoA dehydrogenase family protein n=1 Tax=Sphingomonas caseinilyticus TaxID=2908205 RepID=A0ABT0RUJ1_9SPHN|nr:acyl-CoA dehydrogenase family protein [Sphingomonas caseinilyticus]MCL6698476.1 acyl-CoA dehydrogenase family protein [Sphingomonas caseinilyticus]
MTDWLDWPFFEPRHRELQAHLAKWCSANLGDDHHDDVDNACRTLVAQLGQAGFLGLCVAEGDTAPDVRSLAIARSTLARASGLADFAFAMQGLGSGAISLFGSAEQKAEWLPKVSSGRAVAAYALTEPETGSDAANIAMRAERDGDGWVLTGEKSYISNGTIADVLTVFARTGSTEDGARGISAFIVRGDDPGLSVAERIEVIAPHPLARLKFDRVRADPLGSEGDGFRIAMQTLNLFRVTVGAAALGFARRALDEALDFATSRRLGSGVLADNPMTWDRLAGMKMAVDTSELLIARAAWQQDMGEADNRRAAAMAKLHATDEAQKVIDAAVQMHGGLGVTKGAKVEELYREIRALRIYEGASEVQRMIIARDLLKEHRS